MSRQSAPSLVLALVALALAPALSPVAGAFPPATVPAECYEEAAPFPGADVLFVLDLTGSMGGVLSSAKTEATGIMNDLATQVSDIRFGAASHMDYNGFFSYPGYASTYGSAGDYPWRLDQDMTTDTSLVQAGIDGMFLGSGADGPESYVTAMHEATTDVSWGASRLKVVVFFADNVPHDLEWNGRNTGGEPGPDFLANTADDLDWQTTVANMATAGIKVIGINSGGAHEMMSYLAEQTGGNWTNLGGGAAFRQTIVEMVLGEIDGPTPKDELPPTLSVAAPGGARLLSNGVDLGASPYPETTVIAGDVAIQLAAADDCKLVEVKLSEGATTLAAWTDLPLTYTYPASTLPVGVHTLTATARDWVGHVTTTTLPIRIVRVQDAAHAQGVFVGVNVPASLQVESGVAHVDAAPAHDASSYGARSIQAGLVEYETLHAEAGAAADGALLSSAAWSRIERVSLVNGLITADVIDARSTSALDLTTLGSSSGTVGSAFASLTIGGVPVDVSAPNTDVPLGDLGFVRLFEVESSTTAIGTVQQVNMIHVFLDSPSLKGEILVGSARSEARFADASTAHHRAINDVDDAGTNTDAGATSATGIPLAPGAYSGRIGGDDDVDAYTFAASEGDRIGLALAPAQQDDLRLVKEPTAQPVDAGATSTTWAIDGFFLRLVDPYGATRDRTAVFAGDRIEFNADVNGTWTAFVESTIEPRNYTLGLALSPVAFLPGDDLQGDAGLDCDSARVVDEGAHSGVLRIGDQADAWSFHADLGDVVGVAMKPDELDDGANFDLYLFDTDCFLVAWSELGQPDAIEPKGTPDAAIQVPAEKTGLYTALVVRSDGVGNYHLLLASQAPQPTVAPLAAAESTGPGDAPTLVAPSVVQGNFPDPTDGEDWYRVVGTPGQLLRIATEMGAASTAEVFVYDTSLVNVAHCAMALGLPCTFTLPGGQYYVRVLRWDGGGNYLVAAAEGALGR